MLAEVLFENVGRNIANDLFLCHACSPSQINGLLLSLIIHLCTLDEITLKHRA